MGATLKQTERYTFIKDTSTNTTLIQDNYTGKQTSWNRGEEAKKEEKHLLSISDENFDQYCEMMISNE